MTLPGPVAFSPPAKIPWTDVSSVTGSAVKQPRPVPTPQC